jgi:probable HAF family extracellular repeat protein
VPAYAVQDLGHIGSQTQAWSTNALGDVVGWSTTSGQYPEGYVVEGVSLIWTGHLPGTSAAYAVSINDFGETAGTCGTIYEDRTAAVWTAGTGWQPLGTLGGPDSAAHAINDLTQVVGWAARADGTDDAFLWHSGAMQALPDLGGSFAEARWANNFGLIAGTSSRPDTSQPFGVYWVDGKLLELPPLNGMSHLPYFVHDDGTIVGLARFADVGGRGRATVWREDRVDQRLGTLADGTAFEDLSLSVAYGVNASGVIVGMSTTPTGEIAPFVFHDGVMAALTDRVPAPWSVVNVGPGCINDAGVIVATARMEDGLNRAVRLTPLSDPCSGMQQDDATTLIDLEVLLEHLGSASMEAPAEADLNGDGSVDLADYAEYQRRFSPGCPS